MLNIFHKRKKDILNGSIPQQIMLFLFPALVGYLIQQEYAAIDQMILGKISTHALAVVGTSNTILNIITNIITGICAAITILVAQNYGRGNFEGAKQVIRSGMFVSVILGGIITAAIILSRNFLLTLISTPIDLMADASIYILIYISSIIFYFIYQTGVSILRATGDSKRPLYFIILNFIVKIGLDLLLINVFDLGVVGCGLATFFAHLVCAIAILVIFNLTEENYRFAIKDFGFESSTLSQILKIGVPAALQSALFPLASMYIQVRINEFGTQTIAAFSAYNSVDNYYWCFSSSLSAAVMTIAGQNYGNKNIKRVRKTALWGIIINIIGALLIGGVIYANADSLLSSYTNDLEVVVIAKDMLKVVCVTYWIYSFIEVLTAALKSCGLVMATVYICLFFVCGVRLGFLILNPELSAVGIIYCFPLSWIVTSTVFIIYFLTTKKLKEKNSTN